MLKCLSLTNWCCFDRLVINFDPRCTVFVGDNGHGKSAIQRALLWVCFNRWDGPADAFIRHGKDFAHVTLWTHEHKIERVKGRRDDKAINLYRLDGQDLRFDSVNRRTTPDLVVAALRLGFDNFQLQRDPGYWLALSPGDCAKALNRIVNLEGIDTCLANITRDVRLAHSEEAVCAKRLESWQATATRLAWVDEAQNDLALIEGMEEGMARNSARIAQVERSQAEAATIARLEDRASSLILGGKKALTLYNQAATQQRKVEALESLIRDLVDADAMAVVVRTKLRLLKKKLDSVLKEGCPLCGR